jgi:N-methylhydantoinase A
MDFVDLRYRGQSYELTIPLVANLIDLFHKTHNRRYGYSNPDKAVELVNARTTFLGRTVKPKFKKAVKQRGKPQPAGTRVTWIDGKRMKTAVHDRAALGYGHVIKGPAIIGEYSSTTLVPPDFECRLDAYLNLVLSPQ